ncbi:hypothetical protein NC651_005559 [Populus alba x Populus x berolinensis]|nr:hypothetical protein NC651_005559 [Populus alba x Populus x berolinensis]
MASRLFERITTTQSGLSFLCFIVAFADSFPPGNENWYWNQRGEEGRRGVGEGRSAAFESACIRNPVSQHPRPLVICPSADLRGFQACLFSVTSITVRFPEEWGPYVCYSDGSRQKGQVFKLLGFRNPYPSGPSLFIGS